MDEQVNDEHSYGEIYFNAVPEQKINSSVNPRTVVLGKLSQPVRLCRVHHDLLFRPNVLILREGASPDATCRTHRLSVAHIAAIKGDVESLQELTMIGVKLDCRDANGCQPLHFAAFFGQLEALKILLLYRSDLLDSPVDNSVTPLNDYDILDSWNHDHDALSQLISCEFPQGSTALHLASMQSYSNCVDFLLSKGANINAKDKKGLSALDVAGLSQCGKAHKKTETRTTDNKEQVDTNMNITAFGNIKFSKIMHSDIPSRKDNSAHPDRPPSSPRPVHKIVTALINHGAKMPQGNIILKEGTVINQAKMNVTTLHTAVENEELDLIHCLLNNGASLTTWNDDCETPLHLAVRKYLLEPLKIMIDSDSSSVDVRDQQGRTPLHLAVMQEWPDGVELLLEAGADVAKSTNNSETVLHMAAERGNSCMLRELLSIPDSIKVLEYRNCVYHSPICRAVENKHLECVKVLYEYGADMTISLPGDITLLHMAALNDSSDVIQFILEDMHVAESLMNVRCREERGGVTALHIAAKEGYVKSTTILLRKGCNIFSQTTPEPEKCSTPLHMAAKNGHFETVEVILNHNRDTLHIKNLEGWTPLHVAAGMGQSHCVQSMLHKGADLAATIIDETGRKTALDIIMLCVPQPVDFLEDVFDSYLEINNYPLSHPECKVVLKYDLLVPLGRSGKQLKVLNAILNNGKDELLERLLLHPLVETFLHLKWKKLRIFFFFMIALNLILTLSLTILAYLMYVEKTTNTIFLICAEVARLILFTCLIPIIILEFINASQLQRYYLLDYETCVKWAAIGCTLTVGLIDPTGRGARHLASVAILLSWIELLFLLARVPTWGSYVLMFSKVAINVIKVLASFSFLLLGFTFSFLILFEAQPPFRNFFEAFVKVFVMMLEFDYEDTFEPSKDKIGVAMIGRIIFVSFMVLVSIVMMNLMVGMAVTDIAELEAQGKTQRLAKQAGFLSLLERCVYTGRLQKLIPRRFRCDFNKRRSVPESTVINPSKPSESGLKSIPKSLRSAVIERLWSIALSKKESQVAANIQDLKQKMDNLSTAVDQLRALSITQTQTVQKDEDTMSKLNQILNGQASLKQIVGGIHNQSFLYPQQSLKPIKHIKI